MGRRRLLIAAFLASLAAILGGLAWLLTYDPLAWHGGFIGPARSNLEWSSVDNGVDYPVYYISATKTGTFGVGFDVTNTGRLPVEVVGLDSGELSLSQMGRYSTKNVRGGTYGADVVPFEPVTIDPGDSRYLVLQLEVTDEMVCRLPGSFGIYSHPQFRYRTLGLVPRSATVEAPFRMVTVCSDSLPPDYDSRV